jgi:hypothetical protein
MTDSNLPLTDTTVDGDKYSPRPDRLERVFKLVGKTTAEKIPQSLEDRDAIVAAFILAFSWCIGKTISGQKIIAVEPVERTVRNQGSIDFKVILQSAEDRQTHLGICVLQSRDPDFVTDRLNLLLSYKDFGCDRLCVLRSKELNATTPQFYRLMSKLLSPQIGSSWIDLDRPAVAAILTLLFVFHHRQKYQIDTLEIYEYLHRHQLLLTDRAIVSIVYSISK